MECLACGRCCPSNCGAKTNEGLCSAHPSRNGGRDIRTNLCQMDPVEIYSEMGVACSAVLKNAGYDPDTYPVVVGDNGMVFIRGREWKKGQPMD